MLERQDNKRGDSYGISDVNYGNASGQVRWSETRHSGQGDAGKNINWYKGGINEGKVKMKNISIRTAMFISLGFIILMWIIKVIHNTLYIDTILDWARSMQTYSFYALAYAAFTVIAVTLLLRLSKERYKDIGFNKQSLVKQIGIGFLFGLLIFVLMNIAIETIVDALLPKESVEGTDLSVLFQSILFLPVWIVLAVF
ncbi:hypothetical protein ACFLX0_02720, partial [Chloroflexota bacterium]